MSGTVTVWTQKLGTCLLGRPYILFIYLIYLIYFNLFNLPRLPGNASRAREVEQMSIKSCKIL